MKTSAFHHPGLRVTDIDRSARFYLDAFDGHWLTKPFVLEGEFPGVANWAAPRASASRSATSASTRERSSLFESSGSAHPIEVVHPTRGNLIHFGLQVEDVAKALERVEALGGRRLWPDINPWGADANVIYVADPDEKSSSSPMPRSSGSSS